MTPADCPDAALAGAAPVPAVKAIEDRQQIVQEMLEDCYARVMAVAYAAGRIGKTAIRAEPDVQKGLREPIRRTAVTS